VNGRQFVVVMWKGLTENIPDPSEVRVSKGGRQYGPDFFRKPFRMSEGTARTEMRGSLDS
jgi:hypothetical protein